MQASIDYKNIVKCHIEVYQSACGRRWLVCFLDALTELRGRFGEFTAPFFVLQGTDDKLCDPAGSQMFYDNASSAKKQIKVRAFKPKFHYADFPVTHVTGMFRGSRLLVTGKPATWIILRGSNGEVLTYRALNGIAPAYLSSYFTRVADVPSQSRLRSSTSEQLIVPSFNLTTVGRRAFPVSAANL